MGEQAKNDGDVGDTVPEQPLTREVLRSRRKREVRARTVSVKRMTKREIWLGQQLYPEDEHADVERPKTRGDCIDGPRPCPFVACRHHLYLDVSAKTGAIKLNFPDLEVDELTASCALDVADRQGTTLEGVGAIMNLTRERIRQVEVRALAQLKAAEDMFILRDFVEEGPKGKRRLPLLEHGEEDENESESEGDESTHAESDFDPEYFASEELDAE